MTEFCMTVAGATARVRAEFECTPAFFHPYLTENAPDFLVEVTAADLSFEAAFLQQEAREEGFRPRIFTQPFLERAAIQRAFAEFLFDRGTVLLHGSAVAVDGRAYLFTAASGTGKSTHTRLWRQLFGSRAVTVNDDKPFLQLTQQGVIAHGSPWSGKHGLDSNVSVPLQAICQLRRGRENRIEKVQPQALLPVLYRQCCRPLDPEKDGRLRRYLQELTEKTGLFQMECTKEIAAAQIAYAAMSK